MQDLRGLSAPVHRAMDKAMRWYDTPVPMLAASLRYHRRLYNPWSPRFTRKLLRYTYGQWVAEQHLLTDKLAVRDYVEDRIGPGHLPQLYAVAKQVEKIRFKKLPDQFYLKTNHGCGYNIACPDKSQLVPWQARRDMRKFLAIDYSQVAGERQYHRIERRVYAEEYLDMTAPHCMMLRLFCFDGDVELIQVDTASDRTDPLETSFYLPDWTQAPFHYGRPQEHIDRPRPHNLDQVTAMASALSKGLPFVRVDLYWLDGRIVFSELTLTPSRGTRRLVPARFDRELGRKFDLPRERRSMWARRALRPVRAKAKKQVRHTGKRAMEKAMVAEPVWLGVHAVLGLQRPYRRRQVRLDAIPQHVTHVIVPGAGVRNGQVTQVLRERLDRAVEVATVRPDLRIIVSGDGRKAAHHEDRVMKADLVAQGIAASRIVTDPRGFATIQTMDRAKAAGVRSAVIVTNDFHEARSVHLAVSVGIDAYVVSNPGPTSYRDADRPLRYDERRELLAHLKDALRIQRRRLRSIVRRLRG